MLLYDDDEAQRMTDVLSWEINCIWLSYRISQRQIKLCECVIKKTQHHEIEW